MNEQMGSLDIKPGQTTAFLTDSTICIGCKACEVACKEWNGIEADGYNLSGFSYDNTVGLGASTWRHVKFVEDTPIPGLGGNSPDHNSWEFSSDVCKHCEVAGCLEACPTGARKSLSRRSPDTSGSIGPAQAPERRRRPAAAPSDGAGAFGGAGGHEKCIFSHRLRRLNLDARSGKILHLCRSVFICG